MGDVYHRLKAELHGKLIDRLDLNALNRLSPELLKQEIAAALAQAVADGELPLNHAERNQPVQELLDEILGLGPLESLIRDSAACAHDLGSSLSLTVVHYNASVQR